MVESLISKVLKCIQCYISKNVMHYYITVFICIYVESKDVYCRMQIAVNMSHDIVVYWSIVGSRHVVG